MGILNRRNALVGWVVWQVAKRAARRKARNAVPRLEDGRPNKGLLVAAAVAVAAGVFFWRRHGGEEPADTE